MKSLLAFLLLSSLSISSAQQPEIETDKRPMTKIATTPTVVNSPVPIIPQVLKTPNSEVEDAILFLADLPPEEAQFIRLFTTYNIDRKNRDNIALTLSFVMHSLVGISTDPVVGNAGGYYPLATSITEGTDTVYTAYQRVPGSDTLWWFDLRDFNWTPKSWETISQYDGYFAEPIVQHDRSGVLRLLSGNALVRADWFIFHALNTMAQVDIDNTDIFYSTLLYALGKEPTTTDEWRRAWGVDLTKSRSIGNEYGVLVTKSNAVSRNNRMLFGYRTEIGYLYETYDVKNQQGFRDYLESFFLNGSPGLPPKVADAGELFASNLLGMQVYALRDGDNKLINFGDPGAVRNTTDVTDDVRVRVAHSCMDCHASGPIPAEHTLQEFIGTHASSLKTLDKRDSIRIRRSLLSKRFEDSIADNQEIFARGLKKVNGLEPVKNGILYLQAVRDYSRPVGLELAAFECGVTVEEFKQKIAGHQRFAGRLKLLLQTGEPIPRDIWETPGANGIPGAFQQAMIIINGVTVIEESIEEVVQEKTIAIEALIDGVEIKSGTTVIDTLNKGDMRELTGETSGEWIGIKLPKKVQLAEKEVVEGWIRRDDTKVMEKEVELSKFQK